MNTEDLCKISENAISAAENNPEIIEEIVSTAKENPEIIGAIAAFVGGAFFLYQYLQAQLAKKTLEKGGKVKMSFLGPNKFTSQNS